ncbi:PP2C family protein-serine/threonine phosphatase [Propionicicella superfundia]|uniref:PP2C family protein-serine/threonine phosphatase n=1 Tax=Propionicicella superfundia TaxID=348582 RepID=UPI0004173031|nr:protein phosphatase 2C domain-containing protein [Propionicicella superfundia]
MTEPGLPQPPADDQDLVTEVPHEFQADPAGEAEGAPPEPMISSVPGVDEPDAEEADATPPVIDVPRFCPGCGAQVAGHEQFCEACGLPLVPVEDAPRIVSGEAATAATRPLAAPGTGSAARPCEECGGTVGADGYCETCGTKARSPRSHFEEAVASWLAGVCDRGLRHERNEDALALAVDPLGRGVIVVCDGVSTSADSDVASLAGARAARDLLVAEPTDGQGTAESREKALAAGLIDATIAANAAVVAATPPESDNAASCTIVTVVAAPGELHFAHLGDSRLYWFGDDGTMALLTADDSVAQARIAMGVPREEAETGFQAHAITRWLGRDSEDIIPHTGSYAADGPGWALVCSDGLWNYASDPAALWAQLVAALGSEGQTADPLAAARSLVAWAHQQGGRDNITVALARLATQAESDPSEE